MNKRTSDDAIKIAAVEVNRGIISNIQNNTYLIEIKAKIKNSLFFTGKAIIYYILCTRESQDKLSICQSVHMYNMSFMFFFDKKD